MPVAFGHTDAGPEMVAGIFGIDITLRIRWVPFPHDVPDATFISPLTKPAGKVTEMALVPCPLLMTAPAGTAHV